MRSSCARRSRSESAGRRGLESLGTMAMAGASLRTRKTRQPGRPQRLSWIWPFCLLCKQNGGRIAAVGRGGDLQRRNGNIQHQTAILLAARYPEAGDENTLFFGRRSPGGNRLLACADTINRTVAHAHSKG